jgi:hypothetical protein
VAIRLQRGVVEAAGLRIEPQNRHQQRRRGNEGEEEKLERGLGSVLAAVHGDQDRHRHQRQLPEAVVEHQVERDEDAEHGRLLHQEKREEDLAPLLDGVPTGHDAHRRQQPTSTTSHRLKPIHAHVVEDRGAFRSTGG